MFPDKAKMVRSANALLVTFAVAPVLWLVDSVSSDVWETGLRKRPDLHSDPLHWLSPGFSGEHRLYSLHSDEQEGDVQRAQVMIRSAGSS